MTYEPQPKGNKEKYISLLAAACAIFLIIASGLTNRFAGVYQISAIILGVISIELYLKYVGSDYIYDADEDYFKVYKITGKKSICVSSLDYEMSMSLVVDSDQYVKCKDSYPKADFNVNLCKNLAPSEFYVYFFEFNGKKCMMKFEPDEVFVDYINKKISSAWDKSEDNAPEY